jgi:hypothetical protein
MTNKVKENAYSDWFDMIFKSWTWEKLTDNERTVFVDQMDSWCNCRGLLIGTYKQRWEILNEMYHIYLLGVGYDSPNWRDNAEENPKF